MKLTATKHDMIIEGKAVEWSLIQNTARVLISQFGYQDSFCYDEDDNGEAYYVFGTDVTIAEMRKDYKLAKDIAKKL